MSIPRRQSLPAGHFRNRYTPPLLFLFFVALIPRLLCLWQMQHSALADYLPLDAASYDRWGFLLANGGTGSERFPGLPFYAHFLGGLYRIFGHDLAVVRIAQVLIGSLTCVLTYRLAKNLTGNTPAALVSFAAALLFRPAVFYEMFPLTETLSAFLCVSLLCLLTRAFEPPSFLRLLLAGVVAGAGLCTRINFWAAVPVLALWLFGAAPRPRVKPLLFFLCGMIFVLFFCGTSGRGAGKNLLPFGHHTGIPFFVANGPYADGRSIRFPLVPPNDADLPEAFRAAAEWRTGGKLDDAQLSSFWFRETLGHIRKHPQKFLKLMLRKVRFLVSGFEMPDILSVSFLSPFIPSLQLFPLSFFWLLPLALGGLVLGPFREKRQLLPALFLLSYAVSVLAGLVHERYKVPLYPLLAFYAAYGIFSFRDQGVSRIKKMAAAGIVLLLLALSSDKAFVHKYGGTPSAGYHLLGLHYLKKGNFPEAITMFRKNLAVAPAARLADVHNSLGAALEGNGQWNEAAQEYRAASELDPSYPLPRANLERVEAKMKTRDAAAK